MRFSIVDVGYDRNQVDSCLADLGSRLAWLAARAEAATQTSAELTLVRTELARLRDLVGYGFSDRRDGDGRSARIWQEAAELLDRARAELAAAHEEARLVRHRAYAEALQARRDFEAALHARRLREERTDQLLRSAALVSTPPSANSAVPLSRGVAVESPLVDEPDGSRAGGRHGGRPPGLGAA